MPRKISDEDKEYLTTLRKARLAIVSGAQSYSIGTRSLTRADLRVLNNEIARLEGVGRPQFRRVVVCD